VSPYIIVVIKYLTSWGTVSFSRSTALHTVR